MTKPETLDRVAKIGGKEPGIPVMGCFQASENRDKALAQARKAFVARGWELSSRSMRPSSHTTACLLLDLEAV